jgi:hypothetical protein
MVTAAGSSEPRIELAPQPCKEEALNKAELHKKANLNKKPFSLVMQHLLNCLPLAYNLPNLAITILVASQG